MAPLREYMNKLKGQTAYLAGFIDDDKTGTAASWRQDMTEFLNRNGIGSFDPMNKPILNTTVYEDKDFVDKVNKLKAEGEYEEVSRIMKEIVRQDLKMLDLCSLVILNIDRTCHMCGSYTEFTYACMQRKPVLIYCKQGINAIPNWIYGLGNFSHFFDSWDKLKQHILDIDSGKNTDDLDGKWRFFDYDKVFGRYITLD